MHKIVSIFTCLLFVMSSCSVATRIKKHAIHIEPTTTECKAPTVFKGVPLQFEVKLKNGKTETIGSENPYAAPLNLLTITPSKGRIKNGKLILSPQEITEPTEIVSLVYELKGDQYIKDSTQIIIHYPDTIRLLIPSGRLKAYESHEYYVQYAYTTDSPFQWRTFRSEHYSWYTIQAMKGVLVPKNGLYLPGETPNKTDGLEVRLPYIEQPFKASSIKVDYPDSVQFNLTPRPANHGANGVAGYGRSEAQSGTNGSHGKHAQPVEVWLDAVPADSMFWIKVAQGGYVTTQWLKNPTHFKLKANGGRGGNGGNGGDGSNGTENCPEAGTSGSGGHGGDGGNGASVTVYYTIAAKNLLSVLDVENKGGNGGVPGYAGTRGNDYVESAGILARLFLHRGLKGNKGDGGRNGKPGPKVNYVLVNPEDGTLFQNSH